MGNATSISNKCFLHLTLHCRSTEISYLDNYRYQATALIENRPTNMLFFGRVRRECRIWVRLWPPVIPLR